MVDAFTSNECTSGRCGFFVIEFGGSQVRVEVPCLNLRVHLGIAGAC